MEKKSQRKEWMVLFWVFIIGSIVGYLFEMIVAFFQKGHFESRQGLLYGPFTPVYGMGAVLYYFVLSHVEIKNKTEVFFLTAILGGVLEYMCSYMQEKIFGTISWNYSHLLFDINGRTSLLHCLYWGIAGVLYVSYIKPLLEQLKQEIDTKFIKRTTQVLVIFMAVNISITWIAANRQTERRNHIPPDTTIDKICDQMYPDETMDRVFANKKEVF